MVYFESKYHQDKKFARLKADDTFGTMPYRADNGSAANRLLSRIHRRRVTNIPVSYTHLDVYKRQVAQISISITFPLKGFIKFGNSCSFISYGDSRTL